MGVGQSLALRLDSILSSRWSKRVSHESLIPSSRPHFPTIPSAPLAIADLQAHNCVKHSSTLQIIKELGNTGVAMETEWQAFNCLPAGEQMVGGRVLQELCCTSNSPIMTISLRVFSRVSWLPSHISLH